jgi:hypothetical protein
VGVEVMAGSGDWRPLVEIQATAKVFNNFYMLLFSFLGLDRFQRLTMMDFRSVFSFYLIFCSFLFLYLML